MHCSTKKTELLVLNSAKSFTNLCNIVIPSVKMVKASDLSKNEQFEAIGAIINAFIPEIWAENKYMNHKNGETRVGDSYVKVFSNAEITLCCRTGIAALRDLGNELSALYPSDDKFEKLVVLAWKEYVTLAQKWYAYAPKGEAAIYAEKIKKSSRLMKCPRKPAVYN